MTFIIPLAALAIGIFVGLNIPGMAWGAIPVGLALIYYLYLLKSGAAPLKAIKLNSRHRIWIFLLFLGIGMFDAWFHLPLLLTEEEMNSYKAAEGMVKETVSATSGDKLIVDVTRLIDNKGVIRDTDNLLIFANTDGLSASIGDIIVFPVSLTPVTDNPNYRPSGYADRMRHRGILYSTSLKSTDVLVKSWHKSIGNISVKWRDRIISKIENSSLKRPTAEFIIAMLTGDRSLLNRTIKEDFSNAGVAHILALSGMHVAIIMGILLFLMFPLNIIGIGKITPFVALALLWCFAFFTGFAPSTIRACIMTTFIVLAVAIQRKRSAENALYASAFFILLFDPFAIYDVGLQLSFICVGCLILFAGPLNTVNRHHHPKLHALNSAVLVSLTATLGTWVLVSYYFKKIPLLFLPANLLLLPLLPIFMIAAITYIISLILGYDPSWIAWILDHGFALFQWIVTRLSAFGEATVSFNVQLPVVILWLTGIMVIAYSIKRKKTTPAIWGGIALMAISVGIIPLVSNKTPDGFIIQRKFKDMSLALYDGENEQDAIFPRNSISRIIHKGCEIMAIDCDLPLDSIGLEILRNRKSHRRYLILGGGARHITLENIPDFKSFEKIILHSSLRKKVERRFLQEADSLGFDNMHSLSENGPLNVELQKE